MLIVTLFCVAGIFTSCNKDKDYEDLIVGEWLFLDSDVTDYSMVATYDKNGKMICKAGVLVDDVVGYQWFTSDPMLYTIEDEELEIKGSLFGAELHLIAKINAIENNKLNITVSKYTLDGVTEEDEIGTYTWERTKEDNSYLIGTWKATYPTLNNLVNYYVINANNVNQCYEQDDNGNWVLYEEEKFYCYGDFLAWFWKEEIGDSYLFYEGFAVVKDGDKLNLVNYNKGVTEMVIFERIDQSEIPVN